MNKHTIRNRWIGAGIAAALTAGGGLAFAAAANAAPETPAAHAGTSVAAQDLQGSSMFVEGAEGAGTGEGEGANAGTQWQESVDLQTEGGISLTDENAPLPEGVVRADSVVNGEAVSAR